MNRVLITALIFCSVLTFAAPLGVYQQGTVIRMRMGDCTLTHRGFVANFGPPQPQVVETCPEYTLISNKVVFIIVGKTSNQIVPLADVIDFRVSKNEIAVRIDDAKHESKFAIKEMILRSQWDLLQKHFEDQLIDSRHEPTDSSVVVKTKER